MKTSLVITVAALSILVVGVAAQDSLPRVFLSVKSADTSGFVDPGSKDRSTMLKELTGQLKNKRKTLQLVDTAEQADVTLEIARAGIGVGTTSTSTAVPFTRSVETRANKDWQAMVTLRAGEYQTELSGEGMYTVIVAKQIASSVEKWIKDNQSEVLKRRVR